MVDTLGIILTIIVIGWLGLSIASRIRKETIKETVSSFMTWIKEQLKQK